MAGSDLLVDGFDRVRGAVDEAVEGLRPDQLAHRVDADANSIAWLVWHLSRVQDDHIADASGEEQVWTAEGWVDRFALPFDRRATGFGHDSTEVAAVRVSSGKLLTEYHEAVTQRTRSFLQGLRDPDFDAIVDATWDPPVSLGTRLVSVLADGLQHAGQAAFVRGILSR